MSRNLLIYILAGILVLMGISFANATTINIDARTNTTTNPVVQYFTSGTYDVTPISISDGGTYNAWSAWNGSPSPPSYAGWLNNYSLSSNEFNAYTVKDNIIYSTDLLAFSNAIKTSFTLASDGEVNFFISDYPYWDNVGGISLDVTPATDPVPEPATMLLFVSGSIVLVGCKRKFKKS